MRLTVLGHCGPFPGRGEACSGYLIQEGETSLLVDCGPGTLSRLQEFISLEDLDAVILSHLHPDHVGDFMVLRYALVGRKHPLNVYAPKEPEEVFCELTYPNSTTAAAVNGETELEIGELRICFSPASHSIPCVAVRITSHGASLTYTGDTRYTEALINFAQGSDLLLSEANALSSERERAREKGHLTTAEVGEMGKRAGVKRVLLSHLFPRHDYSRLLAEAGEVFGEGVEIAEEMKTYEIC